MRTKNAIVLAMTLLIAALIMPIYDVNASVLNVGARQTVNIESTFDDLHFRKYVQDNFDSDGDGNYRLKRLRRSRILISAASWGSDHWLVLKYLQIYKYWTALI